MPDASFMFTKDCIVIDHRDEKLYIFSSAFLTYDTDIESEYKKCTERIRVLADHVSALASGKKPRIHKTFKPGKICTSSHRRYRRMHLNAPSTWSRST